VDNIKPFLLDLFFPKFCLGCKKEGTYLCDDCRALLDINESDYCFNIAPNLSGLYFALPYKDKILTKKLIYQFKYPPYLKDLAKTLASILIEHFVISKKNTNEIWENGILIPVPIDKKKLKTRGYNQSEELAKELSKVLEIPTISNVLIKTKYTKPQAESTKAEREKNLQEAFTIKNIDKISGKKIFLVDDVYTTGSTMNECAKVLLKAGAKQVWGIALAREG
jgi:ComF family protein